MNKLFIFALMSATINSAHAYDCKMDKMHADVCKRVRAISDNMANSLPMKMSQSITLDKVYAFDNAITLSAVMAYDKDYLEQQRIQSGVSFVELKDRLKNATKANLCQNESIKELISDGAIIKYEYKYSDYTPLTEFELNSCQ